MTPEPSMFSKLFSGSPQPEKGEAPEKPLAKPEAVKPSAEARSVKSEATVSDVLKKQGTALDSIRNRIDAMSNRRRTDDRRESFMKRIFGKKKDAAAASSFSRMISRAKDALHKVKERVSVKLFPERKEGKKAKPNIFERLFKKPKKEEGIDIAKIFKTQVQTTRKKLTASGRKRRLVEHMEKAGVELEPARVPKIILVCAIAMTAIVNILMLFKYIADKKEVVEIGLTVLALWSLGLFVLWIFAWLMFLIFLDVRMFQRKLMIEEVLPDYLQLTSANIRAGMPIDRALWFAVRPKFGVLAKEIEDVAKRTLSGEDLNKALIDFSKRYDSPTLQRSVYLLIEGTEAGGDIGDLLNKIAANIAELRSMKKEMSANVTTYVIFITFASIIAAPFLFALSEQLLLIVQSIAQGVSASGGTPKGGMLTINISPDNIKHSDYLIFVYMCLTLSSMFSAIIVTTIRKGDVKEGLHYIPIFIAVSMLIFFIASKIMGYVFAGMFG